MPKVAPAKPANAPRSATGESAASVESDADAAVMADFHHNQKQQALEAQQANLRNLAKINLAATYPQIDARVRASMEQQLQAIRDQIGSQIAQLDNPQPATDWGEIELADEVPVSETLANGDASTLTSSTLSDGQWQLRVDVAHVISGSHYTNFSTVIIATPGKAAVLNLINNEIKFTPKLLPATAPTNPASGGKTTSAK